MKCPICKLENPKTATRCDCGYSLTGSDSGSKTDSDYYLRSIAESTKAIKQVVVSWAIVTVMGMVIWLAATKWSTSESTAPLSPTIARDAENEIRAYQKASDDFREHDTRHPNLASYSPDRVVRGSDGRFSVTVVYASHDMYGNGQAMKTGPYLIRCESSLCFVDSRP